MPYPLLSQPPSYPQLEQQTHQNLNHYQEQQVTSSPEMSSSEQTHINPNRLDASLSDLSSSVSDLTTSVEGLTQTVASLTSSTSTTSSTPSESETDTDAESPVVTEFQVQSNVASDSDLDSDSEVKQILESEAFQWRELDTFSPSSSTTHGCTYVSQNDSEVKWDSPQEEEQVEDDDDMPPLISDSEEESSGCESQEEDSQEEDSQDEERVRLQVVIQTHQEEIPSTIKLLALLFFLLHLFHYGTLLKESNTRQHNPYSPCFPFKY